MQIKTRRNLRTEDVIADGMGHRELEFRLLVYTVGRMETQGLSKKAEFRLMYRAGVLLLRHRRSSLGNINSNKSCSHVSDSFTWNETRFCQLHCRRTEPGAVSHHCSRSVPEPHLLPSKCTILDSGLFTDPCP